jgi:hypothetical protein
MKRSRAERALLLHAIALQTAVAVLCRLVRFGWLSRSLERLYPAPAGPSIQLDTALESRVTWAVATAAGTFPAGTTCLTRALTAQCLLRRHGGDAVVRFGVRGGEPIAAHAWLEASGRELRGLSTGAGYSALK